MRVGLVFGGRSVEHRVSVSSARTIAAALVAAGHEVVALGIAPDGCWVESSDGEAALNGEIDALRAVDGRIQDSLHHLLDANIEVLFPVVHGTWGEDGTLQGLCEMLDLPYVGADVSASAISMDKLQCKRVLLSCGIPVVDFESVTAAEMRESAAECLARLRAPTDAVVRQAQLWRLECRCEDESIAAKTSARPSSSRCSSTTRSSWRRRFEDASWSARFSATKPSKPRR